MKAILFLVIFNALSLLTRGQDLTGSNIQCITRPIYGYHSDGKPGRVVWIRFSDPLLYNEVSVTVYTENKKEKVVIKPIPGNDTLFRILLPEGVGVRHEAKIRIVIAFNNKKISKQITVPSMRYWKVFLYNHSHVDVGYSNTQKNVEILHTTNVLEGITVAQQTNNFPETSQFVWNPEVTRPVERLLVSHPEERENILMAIKGHGLGIDAAYVNMNTSACAGETLFHDFRFSQKLEKLTGENIDVFQQVDIPGMTWGLIPVLNQEGIHYVMSWPNTTHSGNAHNIDGKPFWWIGPDGKSKVLFLQPGKYANSGSMEKGKSLGRPWFGQRDPTKVPSIIRTGNADVDFTDKLKALEKENYPYDFLVLSWSLWDNSPVDADVPYAVKSWNEKYAYPKIIISNGHKIISYIEKKYGNRLPVKIGDYTEYWTDGLGSAAKYTAMNRNTQERLIQAETLWTMLDRDRKVSRKEFDEAWRYVLLGWEHTWGAENVKEPFFEKAIFNVKKGYIIGATERSKELLAEALAPVTDKSKGAFGAPGGPSNGGVAVFNTQSWKHDGLVILTKAESIWGNKVIDESGSEVPAQRLSDGRLAFLAPNVPAFGSRHYRVVKGKSSFTIGCKVKDTLGNRIVLENGVIKVVVDRVTGNIIKLIDLRRGYNYVNGALNSFHWLPANKNTSIADSNVRIIITERGPLVAEIEIHSQAKGIRSLIRCIRLVAGKHWVAIENKVDKLPLRARDGIHFGFSFNIPNGVTKYDIPFGIVEVEKDQLSAANRNWLTVQRWLDISNDHYGLTWCSLDAPLVEYSKMTNIWDGERHWINVLRNSSAIYSWVMNNHWRTNFPPTQNGSVSFRYRILLHGPYDPAVANRFGTEQTQPLVHVMADKDPGINPFVKTNNKNVVVTILKSKGNKNVIIRLRSLSDHKEKVNLDFGSKKPESITKFNPEKGAKIKIKNRMVLRPYEVVTLNLKI